MKNNSSEDLIDHVAELYAGPDRDTKTGEGGSEPPQVELGEAL